MRQKGFFSTFPLPEAMTHRVVSYLSVFRLLISMILLYAFFTDLVALPITLDKSAIGGTALLTYFVMAIYLAIDNRRRATEPYPFALVTLFTDLVFITVLLFIFGRLQSGIAILLIFGSASAAMLLPLRIAMFYASLVVLAFIGEALVSWLLQGEQITELIKAGLFGATAMATAILANLLARWLKDYRLTAERQAEQATLLAECCRTRPLPQTPDYTPPEAHTPEYPPRAVRATQPKPPDFTIFTRTRT